MSESHRSLVVVVSDSHIGHHVGLCPPAIQLDDGGTYLSNGRQRFLWESWCSFWDLMYKKLNRKTKLYVVFNGDIVESDSKHRTHQLWSRNTAIVNRVAVDVIDPIAQKAEGLFFVRGTEAHTGKSASLEESLADDFDNTVKSPTSASFLRLRQAFGGVRFEITHHGACSMGRLPWTQKNAANRMAEMCIRDYQSWNEDPPDVVVGSHFHRFSDSGKNYPLIAVYTPAWVMGDGDMFINRIGGGGKMPEIGGVWFLCKDGEVKEWDVELFKPTREAV